jgi:hypothetical protein
MPIMVRASTCYPPQDSARRKVPSQRWQTLPDQGLAGTLISVPGQETVLNGRWRGSIPGARFAWLHSCSQLFGADVGESCSSPSSVGDELSTKGTDLICPLFAPPEVKNSSGPAFLPCVQLSDFRRRRQQNGDRARTRQRLFERVANVVHPQYGLSREGFRT